MQKFTDNQNFDYHKRKNDLKWFIEAKIIYKNTIPDRKWLLYICGDSSFTNIYLNIHSIHIKG